MIFYIPLNKNTRNLQFNTVLIREFTLQGFWDNWSFFVRHNLTSHLVHFTFGIPLHAGFGEWLFVSQTSRQFVIGLGCPCEILLSDSRQWMIVRVSHLCLSFDVAVREVFLLIEWGTVSYPVIRYCARKEEDQQRKKGRRRGLCEWQRNMISWVAIWHFEQ